MNNEQTRFSFDTKTLINIFKGALIAATGAGAIAGLQYLGTLQINDPQLATLVAFLVPFLVNVVKEYIKGK